jgi:hypothetical protein
MHTLENLGYIQFKTHRVQVSKDSNTDRIYCFKSTQSRCELESFESEEEACDYILKAMPTVEYQLVLKDA